MGTTMKRLREWGMLMVVVAVILGLWAGVHGGQSVTPYGEWDNLHSLVSDAEVRLNWRFARVAEQLSLLRRAAQREADVTERLTVSKHAVCQAECPSSVSTCNVVYLSENIVAGPGVFYCCSGNFLVAGAVGCICDNGLDCKQAPLQHSETTTPVTVTAATPTPTSTPPPAPTPTPAFVPASTPTTTPAATAPVVIIPGTPSAAAPSAAPATATPAPLPPVSTPTPGATTPAESTSPASTPAPSSSGQALGLEALRYTNEFRAQNGLGPLGYNSGLYTEALAWSKYMARTGIFRDQDLSTPIVPVPSGIEFDGENVAFFSNTANPARECINLFIQSPPHRANMLGHYDLCAVAFAQNSAGDWYCTQTFGNIFRTA